MNEASASSRLYFDSLHERHRLTGTLTALTALHIGGSSGQTVAASDLPVLRDARGRPFVPGSSLKGVVRSTVEALLRSSPGVDPWMTACDPFDRANACGAHATGGRQRAVSDAEIEKHCAVCRLFGSPVLASHARISDALVGKDDDARIELRDGVAIDRDLRIVYGTQKYDFEVIAPGATFDLEVFVDNPEDWAMGLLLAGFDQLHDGFAVLGGFGSRGLGRVAIAWRELRTCTAAQLLAAEPPRIRNGAQLEHTFSEWRSVLARKVQGDA